MPAPTYHSPPSSPQAGDQRLTDTRADEQERGITIKSTGISLYYVMEDEDLKGFTGARDGNHFLINLIDSPGALDLREGGSSGWLGTSCALCTGLAVCDREARSGACASRSLSVLPPLHVLTHGTCMHLEPFATNLSPFTHSSPPHPPNPHQQATSTSPLR